LPLDVNETVERAFEAGSHLAPVVGAQGYGGSRKPRAIVALDQARQQTGSRAVAEVRRNIGDVDLLAAVLLPPPDRRRCSRVVRAGIGSGTSVLVGRGGGNHQQHERAGNTAVLPDPGEDAFAFAVPVCPVADLHPCEQARPLGVFGVRPDRQQLVVGRGRVGVPVLRRQDRCATAPGVCQLRVEGEGFVVGRKRLVAVALRR
jgi:hypothetical protein